MKNHKDSTVALKVCYELIGALNKIVASGETKLLLPSGRIKTVTFERQLQDVQTWTSESPNLYKLIMTIQENGESTEVVPFNVGFRRIEIKRIEQKAENGKITLFC